MVYVRRHFVRSTSSVAPSGRRTIARWAAAVLATGSMGLTALLLSNATASGSAGVPSHQLARVAPALAPAPSATVVATPAGTVTATPAPTSPDPGGAPRAPEAGSRPSVDPLAGAANANPSPAPVAEESTDRWSFLRSPATGEWLFLTGFLLLLVSIGGLVTVGIYRRRW